ncbi:sensor domain-containing diguanylate cyclase [Alkaliphilus pronyensis]|uniref:Sensor domain-containing diguanylate cyclase n=1 Tax=Alkaliphilus pronyensis TaxID=1482732 RepID=A0A6I0FCW1_9FIRM|nr:diguanylate cyclase [Alkaliphilus pronyensis]KAB3535785.1 sensor domain-containing diguanylate cyclase [Alkaliphilus pronyensis]
MEKAVEIIDGAEKGSLMILNKDNKFEYKALVGFDKEIYKFKIDMKDTFIYKLGKGHIKSSYIINNIEAFDKKVMNQIDYERVKTSNFFSTKTTISSPIIIDDVLYGIINVDSTKKSSFKKDDVIIMEYFAKQAGAVIRNHQLFEKMLYLSQYDKLTNVLNRGYFEELFHKTIKKAQRYNEKFALVIFDLDNLKTTNDTYGHQVGDKLIQSFAHVVKSKIRQSDLFARYGGDEFIAVFFEIQQYELDNKIDEIVQELAKNPLIVKDTKLYIEFSYGVALYPKDAKEMNRLTKLADDRMYQHKQRLKES